MSTFCISSWPGFFDATQLTTASQAVCNTLRGETTFRQDENNVASFSSSGSIMVLQVSTPGIVQRTPLVYPILLKCKYCQIHWHNYQAIFFPNLNISIKHRQIGGQSVRLALHKRFSTTVGCRFAWRRIRWFQQSRDSLKRRESSDICQVSVGPTRASRLDPSLDCRNVRFWLPTLVILRSNATQYFGG